MPVEYRLLRAGEIDAAAALWVDEHASAAQRQAWLSEFRAIPQHVTHTRVAVADDGTLLSIVHYWPIEIHDATGQTQRVGRVSHVFTRPDARRQGHAARLLELTLAAMRAEGCLWSILSTSEEGRPLYERYGYHTLPLRTAACLARSLIAPGDRYTVRSYDPEHEPGGWDALARIHRAYNAARPLTMVRDDALWRYAARRITWWRDSGQAELFVAVRADSGSQPCAYALALFSAERGFWLAEFGALPGEDDALTALLTAIITRADGDGVKGRLCLPRDHTLEGALAALCDTMTYGVDEDTMVRAIAPAFDVEMLDALPNAPGAVMWLLDDI